MAKPVRKPPGAIATMGDTSNPLELYRQTGESAERNRALTAINLYIMQLPPIDMYDAQQVGERLNDYFRVTIETGTKPKVSGLAAALGVQTATLKACKLADRYGGSSFTKALPREVVTLIQQAYQLLEMNWEDYMLSGVINPASGIFIGKNQFGYKDVQDTRVIQQPGITEDISESDLLERYGKNIETQDS